MKDNEIIKALEYCSRGANYITCNSSCPMYEYCESDEEDKMNICGLALDLINHQKAEIERLNSKIEEANRIEKENELEALEENKENAKTFLQAIQHAKSEAIKEFAERLKESLEWRTEPLDDYDIDELVKEMTEEKELERSKEE